MRAGPLRHRVEFQRSTETRAADGGVIRSWNTYARRFASIDALSGREFHEAGQTQARVTHRIVTRHIDGVTTGHRIIFGTRTFDVEHARNVRERDEQTELMVREDV